MQTYPINKIRFDDKIIIDTINQILKTDAAEDFDLKDTHSMGMVIGELLMDISKEETLEKAISTLDKCAFFKIDKENSEYVDEIVSKAVAEGVNGVRVKSICYGVLLKKASYNRKFNPEQEIVVPSPIFIVCKNYVKHNLDEIIYEINRAKIRGVKDDVKKRPLKEQAQQYKVAISTMAEISIDHDTDEFDKDMERLKIMKENIVDEKIYDSPTTATTGTAATIPEVTETPEDETNLYPRMFTCTNAWKLFESWVEKKEKGKTNLADFSFIYRRMQKDGLIYKGIKPSEYTNWLKESTPYDIDIDKVKQLWNCSSDANTVLYNTLKNIYEPYTTKI